MQQRYWAAQFDDLASREEERRKARLRQQLTAVAAVLSVIAIGGTWWWDANLRIKTEYCAAYGERWAAPFCVGELSTSQQAARSTSYRFHTQGGRVLDMTRVNGSGTPTAASRTGEYEDEPWTKDVAEWRYAYRSDAGSSKPILASAVYFDNKGKQLRQISYDFSKDYRQAIARFDRDFGVAERQSAAGSGLSLNSVKHDDLNPKSNIGQHLLSFDAQGLLLRREFEPVGGEQPLQMRSEPMAGSMYMERSGCRS